MALNISSRPKVLLKRVVKSSQRRTRTFNEMVRTYLDMDKTLGMLTRKTDLSPLAAVRQINVTKLIRQLNRSKKRLQRKINNTLLIERHHLKQRLEGIFRR